MAAAAKSRCRPLLSGSSYAGRHSNKTQQTESHCSRDKKGESVGRGLEAEAEGQKAGKGEDEIQALMSDPQVQEL